MVTNSTFTHPVRTLRELATSLEAALSVCIAGPSPKAVHRVRTTIRRIEAQMLLLAQIPHLPPHNQESKKLQKRLNKLSRIAATIRDLDVQRQLILLQCNSQTAADARRLRFHLKHKRERETPALLRLLRRRSARIGIALECLLDALQPAENIVLPATQLVRLAQRSFARRHHAASTDKQLHATRKAAKLARYMVEGAPDSAQARKVAMEFESIQQAGGEWHDWLQLTVVAGKKLGKRHPLVQTFSRKCETSLRIYRGKLAKIKPRQIAESV